MTFWHPCMITEYRYYFTCKVVCGQASCFNRNSYRQGEELTHLHLFPYGPLVFFLFVLVSTLVIEVLLEYFSKTHHPDSHGLFIGNLHHGKIQENPFPQVMWKKCIRACGLHGQLTKQRMALCKVICYVAVWASAHWWTSVFWEEAAWNEFTSHLRFLARANSFSSFFPQSDVPQ